MTTMEQVFMWIGIITVATLLAKFGVSGMSEKR